MKTKNRAHKYISSNLWKIRLGLNRFHIIRASTTYGNEKNNNIGHVVYFVINITRYNRPPPKTNITHRHVSQKANIDRKYNVLCYLFSCSVSVISLPFEELITCKRTNAHAHTESHIAEKQNLHDKNNIRNEDMLSLTVETVLCFSMRKPHERGSVFFSLLLLFACCIPYVSFSTSSCLCFLQALFH